MEAMNRVDMSSAEMYANQMEPLRKLAVLLAEALHNDESYEIVGPINVEIDSFINRCLNSERANNFYHDVLDNEQRRLTAP